MLTRAGTLARGFHAVCLTSLSSKRFRRATSAPRQNLHNPSCLYCSTCTEATHPFVYRAWRYLRLTVNTKSLYQLLRQARYSDLDRHLQSLQSAYENGQLDEYALADGFNQLCFETLPSLQWLLNWQKAVPESYAANYCLASWCSGEGWDSRGQGTANEVSEAGWQGLASWHERAREYAQKSLSLSAKPILSFALLGNLQRSGGNQRVDLRRNIFPDWYQQGLRIAPGSVMLRIQMMHLLRPEWGGSKEMLAQFVQLHKDNVDMHTQLDAAQHRFLIQYAAYFENSWDKVELHLALAKRLAPTNVWTAYWQALALCQFDRMDEANTVLREEIKRAPNERELYEQLTNQLVSQGKKQEVIDALKPLVQNGDARAIERTADRLLELAGESGDKRLAQEAKEHYEYLWDGLHARSGNALANMYFNGELLNKDLKRACELARASADMGQVYSSQLVWNGWRGGEFAPFINAEIATQYLVKAWQGGNPHALARVLEAMEEGRVEVLGNQNLRVNTSGQVTRELLAKAFELRREAADEGDVKQQLHLAKLMMEGNEYFPPDKVAGLHWYEQAAENGDDYAQVMLGWYLARGEHCELNYVKAIDWLELALEQDNQFAHYEMGRLCLDGLGQTRNLERALQLLEVASVKHKRSAAFELLASRYFYGRGLPKDLVKARYWMEKARELDVLSEWMKHQLSVFEAGALAKMFKSFTPIDKADLIDPLPKS
jgi:TPR repeat protein